MSIIISTDLQLITYIHVWNIDKTLFFNYRGKLGKNKQIEPRKNYMQRKNSPNQPQPLPHPALSSPIAILINLHFSNAVITIFPAKTIVQFLRLLILCEGHLKQSLFFSLPTLSCF